MKEMKDSQILHY